MYLAALAALPMISKLEQGLVDKVASLFHPSSAQSSGQNVPSRAVSQPANSAQPTAARPLSLGMNAALVAMQAQAARQGPVAGGYRSAAAANVTSMPTTSLKV